MSKCQWVFKRYEPKKWGAVTASYDFTKEHWLCIAHGVRFDSGIEATPEEGFCAQELRRLEVMRRKRVWEHRWWLFRTLPYRLWRTLIGRDPEGDSW